MNYFPFHVGDYAAHTRHLSLMEDLAYRRLLDAYYLAERPLNGSSADVARMIGMREYAEAVDFVLRTFFVATEEGYRNARADREIELFSAKRQQQSKAGKASAERRLNDRSTTVQPTNNQNQNQNQNQPSLKETGKRKAPSFVLPDWVDAQAWGDFEAMRKAQRKPMTDAARRLALSTLAELRDSGQDPAEVLRQSTFRCWAGLFPIKADAHPAIRAHGMLNRQEAIEAQNRAVADEWLRQQEDSDAPR